MTGAADWSKACCKISGSRTHGTALDGTSYHLMQVGGREGGRVAWVDDLDGKDGNQRPAGVTRNRDNLLNDVERRLCGRLQVICFP